MTAAEMTKRLRALMKEYADFLLEVVTLERTLRARFETLAVRNALGSLSYTYSYAQGDVRALRSLLLQASDLPPTAPCDEHIEKGLAYYRDLLDNHRRPDLACARSASR